MALAEYKRKRNFRATPEPAGGGDRGHGIFVVQLHHARRRHYDFRLEHAGTLKSWAVPKGPSFDPNVKRMAVQVEDHPLSYAGFEGGIPEGNYGAGHVDVFDRGTWEPLGSVREGLAKGELKFTLNGDVLRGSWVLVRTRKDGKKPQWLLIKHRDAYAGEREADDFVDPRSDRPLPLRERRKVWKDAKPARTAVDTRGRSAERGTAEAIDDGPFQPELCKPEQRVPAGDGWLHEAKWDGYRILATIKGRRVRLWSRNGLEWTRRLPELVDALRSLGVKSAQLDGEMVALRGGRDDFNALQGRLSAAEKAPLAYMLFDMPYLDGHSLRELPLLERKARLEALLKKHPGPLSYSAHQVGDGPRVYAQAVRAGLEGIVSKRADSAYVGTRNGDWVKIKARRSDEFVVIGFTEPKGSRSGIGALLLARPRPRGGLAYIGRVGTGFSSEQLRTLRKDLAGTRIAETPVDVSKMSRADRAAATWVEPALVVEVYHQGLGGQGLLRQPALKTVREDKSLDDIVKDARPASRASAGRAKTAMGRTPRATAGGAKKAAKKKAPKRALAAATADGVRLTHPEREVFPGSGVTKGDVAAYYAKVAPLLLADVGARPLSVLRCPDGVGQACFFQKHTGRGWGDHVRAVAVKEKGGGSDRYLAVDDATGVLQLVQMNVLEFHPWGARASDLEHADRVIFDLDPHPSVAWSEVKKAARTVHDALAAIGLESFLRTSGGKGLHVVVPLASAATWADAKRFAEQVADTLASERPQTFVSVAGEQKRERRIFIDWLRNARGATSVGSYSLRAREGAPVAMPIEWSELARLRSAAAYDIRSALAKIARRKRDPWEGFDRVRQALPSLRAAAGERPRRRRGRTSRADRKD